MIITLLYYGFMIFFEHIKANGAEFGNELRRCCNFFHQKTSIFLMVFVK